MEEIKKSIIVFASVLKPTDDTRMFEKMAQSLSQANKYEIHIIGYPARKMHVRPNIFIHPLKKFKRLSLKRLLAPVVILNKVWRIKPALLVINTHELLGVAFTMKLLRGCRFFYDVQENYFRNILFTNAFPIWARPFLALYVRLKEISFSPLIDQFILAEAGYERELKFLGKRKVIIENKVKLPQFKHAKKSKADGLIHLLFSGTLAETTGVLQAIELTKKLQALNKKITLTIIGYCPQHHVLEKIKKSIQDLSFINLIGGNELIPHTKILEEIQQADFGIISYPPNPSTKNALPTKLYEYLGNQLPILLTDYKPWTDKCASYAAAVIVNFQNPNVADILHQMLTANFYTSPPTDVYWEEDKFIEVIKG